MPGSNLQSCEYVLIRIVPDPIRNESVNIGVALFDPNSGGFVGVRITPDLRRARQLSPHFEEGDLDGLEADLIEHLKAQAPAWNSREYLSQLSQECFSHALQFSAPTAVLTADPAAELDRLYHDFAAPLQAPRMVEASARSRILAHLERTFTEQGVLHRMQTAVGASAWLGRGDHFRFDFHYLDRQRQVCLIQALPQESSEVAVKDLCFTTMRLRAKLSALYVAGFREDAAPPAEDEAAAYQAEMLDSAGIRVLPIGAAGEEAIRIRERT